MKVGQKIKIRERITDRYRKTYSEMETSYKVKEIYPHIVLCEQERTGTRRCFCIGDLVVLGLVKQDQEIEAKRILTTEELRCKHKYA